MKTNTRRSRAFFDRVSTMAVGDALTFNGEEECPPESTIRNIARKHRFFLSKVRVPLVSKLVVVRVR